MPHRIRSRASTTLLLCILVPLSPGQGPVVNPANGHTYLTTGPSLDIFQARAEAAFLGGYLVAVNDAAEDAFVASNFTGRMWIGLSDELTEGTFLWDSGEPFGYSNWCLGEPNNSSGNENWVERDFPGAVCGTGQWNDLPSTLSQPGIIELPFSNVPFQPNQPGAALLIDGIATDGYKTPVSVRCTGATGTASFASVLSGAAWEAAVAVAPLVPANNGGFITTGGQVLNVDPTAPVFLWWFGGAAPNVSGSFVNFTAPYTAPASPLTSSIQMLVVDGTHPDGAVVSQAAQIDALAGTPAPQMLTLQDDQSILLSVTAPPLCGFGSVNFYGTSYSELYVHSNGEVLFTAPSVDFTVTVAEFHSQMPRCSGMWTDLSPNMGGTVTVIPNASDITVSFAGVPEFSNAASANSVDMVFDAAGGTTISGYAPDPTHVTTTLVGITNGSNGTAGAAVSFLSLVGTGPQGGGLASDSVYELFTSGAVPPGWSSANWPLSDGTLYSVN